MFRRHFNCSILQLWPWTLKWGGSSVDQMSHFWPSIFQSTLIVSVLTTLRCTKRASLMRAESFNNLCVDRSFCGTEWLQDQAGQKLHLHLWLDTHLEDSLIVWQDNNRFTSGGYEIHGHSSWSHLPYQLWISSCGVGRRANQKAIIPQH